MNWLLWHAKKAFSAAGRRYAPQQKPDLFNHLIGALDLLRLT
jgi:hypothetical protein